MEGDAAGQRRQPGVPAICADPSSEDYPSNQKVFTNEDCLYLNVWAPKSGRTHRPVIVYIHGGAAIFGNANEARYDGSTLATTGDAIVVTLNYRLGVLGWTELGGLDPKYRGSGNNGLRDQIAALTWIRQHVADFGGDPGNVTAVGESEGAFSLSAMLATDHPQRLFHRAILESGTGYLDRSASLEKKEEHRFLLRDNRDQEHRSAAGAQHRPAAWAAGKSAGSLGRCDRPGHVFRCVR